MTAAPDSRLPIWLILCAAVAAGAGLWLSQRYFAAPSAPALQNAVLYPQPRAIAEFHLAQANGQPLDLASWRGHWNVVYFGYTSCPDVCPTTLAVFKQAWKDLGVLKEKLRFEFISVDPQRDTPEQLGKYVAFFSPDFVAATGSDEELTKLTRALGLMYSRTTDANGAVQVDHSGSAVIVDPQGRLVGMFRSPFTATAIAADLTTLSR
ncbi:MAG TPA: SCO family protein [Burkholderiales bacterium]|nr:SCO family protein [Burkholderiales bacterium]